MHTVNGTVAGVEGETRFRDRKVVLTGEEALSHSASSTTRARVGPRRTCGFLGPLADLGMAVSRAVPTHRHPVGPRVRALLLQQRAAAS